MDQEFSTKIETILEERNPERADASPRPQFTLPFLMAVGFKFRQNYGGLGENSRE